MQQLHKSRKLQHHEDDHKHNRHNILLAVFALLLAGCITIIADI